MNRCKFLFLGALFSMGTAVAPANLVAQSADLVPPDGWAGDPPTISSLVEFAEGESNLRTAVIRYVEDKAGIERRYPVLYSPARMDRLREFHNGWKQQLQALDFESLNYEGQIDYILLRNRIDYNLEILTLDEQRAQDLAPLIPFFDEARALEETRLDRKRAVPREAAATLDHIARTATDLADNLRAEANEAGSSKVAAARAANQLEHLREILSTFNAFYDGFDPFIGRKQTKAEQNHFALNAKQVFVKTGIDKGNVGDAVGDQINFLRQYPIDLL